MNKLRKIIFFIINVLIILINFTIATYAIKEQTSEPEKEEETPVAVYSNLYVWVKGRRLPYLYNEHVKDKYVIADNHLYENGKNLGEIIGYDVSRPLKTEVGEFICEDIRCTICPLQWVCKQQSKSNKTLYKTLESRDDIPDKIHKKLYKELKRKVNK